MNYIEAYELLKLPESASIEEIKSAYRALSLQYHPDRNNNSEASNVAFLQIKKAYNYLVECRQYDSTKTTNLKLKQLPPNEFTLQLSLEELFSGCTKVETISRKTTNEDNVESIESKLLSVEVKPGLLTGTRVTVEKEGDIYHQSIPANVVFIIEEIPHSIFTRSRFDLKYTQTITTEEALLGCKLQIPTLDGDFLLLIITETENVTKQTVKVFPNRGMPYPSMPQKRGNLLVNFDIIEPLDDVVKDIFLSLIEVMNGCTKNVSFQRKIFELDQSESVQEHLLEVNIKPGIKAGTKIRFPKEGNQQLHSGQKSDAIFIIRDLPNDVFKRSGADIIYTAPVTLRELREGCQLKIPTLESNSKSIKWNIDGELNADGYRIVNKGLPHSGDNTKRGDLVVHFKVVQQSPPIEKDIFLNLEEVYSGCTKLVTHTRKITDENGYELFEKKKFILELKPGVEDGTEIANFPQEGDQDPESVPADLIFIARDAPHDALKRIGANLEYNLKMTKIQSLNGGKFEIPTIDKKIKILHLEGPINDSFVKTIKRFGLPHANDSSKFGDLLVKFELIPDAKPKDPDIEHNLPLTLQNILNGCTKNVKINRLYLQPDGTECIEDKIINIKVPAGTLEGTKFRFENCGDETEGRIPADVVFIARDKLHCDFKRNGANIEYTALITKSEAANGFELEIPTLEADDTIRLSSKNLLDTNVTKNYPKRGLPIVGKSKKRGDLIVKFEVVPDDKKNSDKVIPMTVTLETLLTGATKQMTITRKVLIQNGKEETIDKVVTICIKPGTEVGTQFTFSRHGDQRPGFIPGNVVFVLEEEPHSLFKRNGPHLEYTANVTSRELLNGGQVDIPTLEREIVHLKFNNAGKEEIIPRKGLPFPTNSSKRGDIIVHLNVIEYKDAETKVDPIYFDLELTLDEVYEGTTKIIPLDRKITIQNDMEYVDVKVFTIKIPPGIESGKEIIMPQDGNRCYGKIPGDVIFVIKEKAHEHFVRKGADIEYSIEIDKNESVFGFQRKIPILGKVPFYLLKVFKNYHSSTKVLEGFGLPLPNDPEKRGDMIVKLNIADSDFNQPLVYPPVELKIHLTLEEVLKGYSKDYIFHKKIFHTNGRMQIVDEILEIRTRPGIATGEQIVFERRGTQYPNAIAGNVIFTIEDRPHKIFRRKGADIELTAFISKLESRHGFTKDIPTLEGGTVCLTVNELVRLNTSKIIEGKGLPFPNDPTKRGNIVVKFRIVPNRNTEQNN